MLETINSAYYQNKLFALSSSSFFSLSKILIPFFSLLLGKIDGNEMVH